MFQPVTRHILVRRFSSIHSSGSWQPKTLLSPPCGCRWTSLRQRGGGSGRKKGLLPVEAVPGSQKSFSALWKPLGFTCLVSGCSFTGAAIWQYETILRMVREAMQGAKKYEDRFYGKAGGYRQRFNQWWNGLSRGQQVVAGIITINIAVYLLWKVAPLSGFMVKYFTSSPMSGAPCWSMLLSTFSHYTAFHLAANMYVLWSFAPSITSMLGPEQFVAMYLTAGVLSSLTSYVYKIARRSMVPSLGASGAILGVLGAVCCQNPDARLSIAFVDQIYPHSFSASGAMKTLIVVDSLGILLGWRLLDHAAHLGGMLFGIWYVKYGQELIWKNRETFLLQWHKFRGSPTPGKSK